jgi:hypothetical protein
MRRWRKTTWVIVIWTVLMVLWMGSAIGASGKVSADPNYAAGIATLGVTFLIVLWLLVLAPLALVWFGTRPKENVTVYGPDGQQVMVSEKEARKRVEQGWTYQRVG